MSWFRPKHVRSRLTLLYVFVLAGILLLYSAGTACLSFWQMRGQLQRHAVEDIETVEGLLYFHPDGRLAVHDDYHNHPESKRVQERLLEVLEPDGAVLFRNDRLHGLPLGGRPFRNEGVGGYSPRSARVANGERVLLVSRRHVLDGHPLLLRLAYSEEPIWDRIRELLAAALLALPIALAAAAFAGYGLARRALSPLTEMARQAEAITAERLHERLPAGEADDELAHLALVFNGMLTRLQAAFEQLRRFTSDASHELRTPLAAIRSIGEVGLQKDASREEYRDIVGSMLEEVNRLTDLTDQLLTIARADAGHLRLQVSRFSALELAREAAGVLEVLADEKSQILVVSGDERAMIEGDRLLLRQTLINILHNAVKFSPQGGEILARVRLNSQVKTLVEIRDSGPGLSPEDRGKIFDRFYRIDKARSRDRGGAGLGLSIAKWVVEANGGTISVESEPGAGCLFKIELPAAGETRRSEGLPACKPVSVPDSSESGGSHSSGPDITARL